MKTLVAIVVLFSAQHPARAGLKWNERQLEFRPASDALETKGDFRFTNTGNTAITVQSVETECGCTTAVLDKTVYQPGESGRITATFTIGQREGEQTKHIQVRIQGEKEPVTLTIITHIPELVRLTPNFVYWQAGEPVTAKTVVVTVVQDAPVELTKVTSSHPKLQAALETVNPGREYRIKVTPTDTASDAMAVLTVEGKLTSGQVKTFQAFAQIKPPVN